MKPSSFSGRLYAAKVISIRGAGSAINGIGFYVILGLSFLLSSYILKTYLDAVQQTGLAIMRRPLDVPLSWSVQLCSAYLAVIATISIAHERDQGTLEVLFYGPVDSFSYVLGKYAEHMIVFGAMVVFYVAYFALASVVTGFGFSLSFLATLALSVVLVSCMVAFGICLSSIIKNTKTCIVVLIGLIAGMIVFQYVYAKTLSIHPDSSSVMVYAKHLISIVNGLVRWVSPISYLQRGFEALAIESVSGYAGSVLTSLAYTIIFLGLAVVCFDRRGVTK